MTKASSRVRLFRLRERIRMGLWIIPAVGVGAAGMLAVVLLAIDRRIAQGESQWFLFGGGAESARNLLSVIAGSMVTSISLIFSVTMVVLQLASAQYSPRVLRSFIRDRLVQVVLSAYITTFVYALVLLPSVRSSDAEGGEYVPAAAVTVALGLALGSVALFVRYVHHIAHSIRAVTIINGVAEETRAALDRLYPEAMGEEAVDDGQRPPGRPSSTVTWPSTPGVVVAVDEQRLMQAAVDADVVVELRPLVGEFVPSGAPIVDVWGELADPSSVQRCLTVGEERTLHQDAAYGFRQMVDIAERALSPGVNDPTTAVQVVDQVHDLLRRLATRRFPSVVRTDETGTPRVIAPRFGWEEYVHLAFDEIRHYSGSSVQVARRLDAAVEDLLTVAPPARRAVLREQRSLLGKAADREFEDQPDREAAKDGRMIS